MKAKNLVLGALSAITVATALPAAASAATMSPSKAVISVDSFGRPSLDGLEISAFMTAHEMEIAAAGDSNGNCGNCGCTVKPSLV